MTWTRRAVVATTAATLAGCGRSFRENEVPGGLLLENRDDADHEVAVAAWRVQGTPTASTETTPPSAGADVTATVILGSGESHPVPDFFPRPGRYLVRATLDGQVSAQTTLELHRSVPGPAGVDTVLVTVEPGGALAVRATTVD